MGLTTMSGSKIADGFGAKHPASFGFRQTMLKYNPMRSLGTSSSVVMKGGYVGPSEEEEAALHKLD